MFNISDVFDKIKKEFSEEPLKPEIPETKSVDFDKYAVCLLYTSPSPRDMSASRMPSSA